MIFIEEALTSWVLEDYPYSVITKEQLSLQIFKFYLTKEYKGERIQQIRKDHAAPKDYENNIHKLKRSGVLSSLGSDEFSSFSRNQLHDSYVIKGKPSYTPQEIICALYPYGHLSHLSAMEWHGLTDKIPVDIYFTTCSPVEWRRRAVANIDLEDPYLELKSFTAKYPKSLVVDGRSVVVSSETHYVEPLEVSGSPLRVSSIGKTFIDMMREPQRCGGEEHVLEIFLESGKKYSSLIIAALNKYGRKIDRARVGFVLDKMVGVKSSKLDALRLESGQSRGSSKVLSPDKPFASDFDADWSLSLNVDMAKKYGNAD